MTNDELKGIVASELIIIAREEKSKRPTELTFEELVDITALIVQKDLIAGVVKSYCKCSEPKPNYPELLWCKYCGDWIPE